MPKISIFDSLNFSHFPAYFIGEMYNKRYSLKICQLLCNSNSMTLFMPLKCSLLGLQYKDLKTMNPKVIPLNCAEGGHFNALKLSIFKTYFQYILEHKSFCQKQNLFGIWFSWNTTFIALNGILPIKFCFWQSDLYAKVY